MRGSLQKTQIESNTFQKFCTKCHIEETCEAELLRLQFPNGAARQNTAALRHCPVRERIHFCTKSGGVGHLLPLELSCAAPTCLLLYSFWRFICSCPCIKIGS